MMLQRLVVAPVQIDADCVRLSPEQHHYLQRVLRLEVGDRFLVMDGQGGTWLAQIEPDRTLATLLEAVPTRTELSLAVTLVMALPKGNGFDDVVRQATELGVSQIVPVVSDRTLLQPSPQKLERWRRIAQEAAEQSERQIVPTLAAPTSFLNHLKDIDRPLSRAFLCVTRHNAPHLLTCLQACTPYLSAAPYLSAPRSPNSPLLLAIGPEGGWTEAEVEMAIAAGYQLVSLGNRILRSVTAPIAALSLVAAVWENQPNG